MKKWWRPLCVCKVCEEDLDNIVVILKRGQFLSRDLEISLALPVTLSKITHLHIVFRFFLLDNG